MGRNIADNQTVSVIIPVYQAEKYLTRCVKSVTNQTYEKIEIILIDDGSKDKSFSLCNELAGKDSRIRIFHHENMGVAATRNKGLDYATGQYAFFLDSDDWIAPNTLYDMVTSLDKHNADLSICGFFFVNDKTEKECCIAKQGCVCKKEFANEYFWKLYDDAILFNIGTKLYKRNIIEENNLRFHTEMIVYEDIRFCLEYIDKAEQVFLSEKSYYYYFQGNTDSITHVYKKDFWKSTSDYCQMLICHFNDNSTSFKKAVLICLYRAYLQECHNPHMNKKDYCLKMKEMCYPYVEKADFSTFNVSELSIDQKIFMKLVLWKCSWFLWMLAIGISVKRR